MLTAVKILGPLVTLPYLARVLGRDSYGVVAFVKAYGAYAQIFVEYGFMLSATKDIATVKHSEREQERIVSEVLFARLFLSGCVLAVSLSLMPQLAILEGNWSFFWIYLAASMVSGLVCDFLFRGLEVMEYVAVPFVVARVFVVTATLVLINDADALELLGLLELVGSFAVLTYTIWAARRLRIRFRLPGSACVWRVLVRSSPYFFSNFATTVFGVLTTLIVGFFLKPSDVAFWSVSYLFVSAAKSLYSPMVNALFPRLVNSRDVWLVKRVAMKGGVIVIIGTIMVAPLSGQLLMIVGGQDYSDGSDVLLCLLPAIVFSYFSMLYGWPLLGVFSGPRMMMLTTVWAAVVQVVLIIVLMLVGRLSLLSLAVASSMSEFVLLLVRLILLRRLGVFRLAV